MPQKFIEFGGLSHINRNLAIARSHYEISKDLLKLEKMS
jgi:hypothetical protein